MTNDSLQLQIEKVVFGGDGLARISDSNSGKKLTAFVPFTLPGEHVAVRPGRQQKGFVQAQLLEVLTPSPERRHPPCAYFGRCGGCQLQHGKDAWQLAAKQEMVRETLSRAGVAWAGEIATIAGEPLGYRTRIHLRAGSDGAWQIGYLERRSNRLVPIQRCPIAAPVLERTIMALQKPEIVAAAPAGITDIELFCDPAQQAVLLSASGDFLRDTPAAFSSWMQSIAAEINELAGGVLRAPGRPGTTSATVAAYGKSSLECVVGAFSYRVSEGAFFQGNRCLTGPLVEAVVAAAQPRTGAEVWDLYAGVGLFSLPMAAAGAVVTAVEGSPISGADLEHNLRRPSRVFTRSVEAFLAAKRKPAPDCVVVDPPRTGLGSDVSARLSTSAAPRLVYLSCDPPTLARDLKVLTASGYRMESVTVFDLFPQTYHIETLAVLTRG